MSCDALMKMSGAIEEMLPKAADPWPSFADLMRHVTAGPAYHDLQADADTYDVELVPAPEELEVTGNTLIQVGDVDIELDRGGIGQIKVDGVKQLGVQKFVLAGEVGKPSLLTLTRVCVRSPVDSDFEFVVNRANELGLPGKFRRDGDGKVRWDGEGLDKPALQVRRIVADFLGSFPNWREGSQVVGSNYAIKHFYRPVPPA